MEAIQSVIDQQEDLNDTEENLRANQVDISELHDQFTQL